MSAHDVVPASPTVRVPVATGKPGSATFPVRRIFCVGRNYAEHAREMGHDPEREAPFFFTKPADAITPDDAILPFPPMTDELHHEVELIVAIGAAGSDIPVDRALDHIYGYAVGLDMTRRDLQRVAKETGRPWDLGKAFDHSAPCGVIVPAAAVGHPAHGSIRLSVNGSIRQDADLSELIWSVPEIIAYLSRYVRLEAGDLIMTGTPAGIGPVHPGDEIVASVDGVGTARVRYARH